MFVNKASKRKTRLARRAVLLTSSSDAPASMSAAADKSVLGTPSGVDDLWAMMGMKKFSIMDDGEAKGEAPDLGQPLLSSMLVDIDLTLLPGWPRSGSEGFAR